MKLKFQVTDCVKPLMAVKRIVERGNRVCFGPGEGDNYIANQESGDKLMLKENGKGSCIMEVDFVGGGKAQITVDSGVGENVCPWEWGDEFGVNTTGKKMVFRGANGAWIDHYGERKVFVQSPF